MTRVNSIETARTAAAAALREIAPTVDAALFEIIGHAEMIAAASASVAKRAASRYTGKAEAAKLSAQAEELSTEADTIAAEADTLRKIARAGAWARFYYVPGGHVHRETCSTLRPTTTRLMITEYAAASDEEIVEAAGSRACTVCFSDAPIDPRRASVIRYVVEEEEARAAEAAEKAAKAKAAADSAIRHEDGSVAFKSRRAAENALSREIDDYVYYASYSKGYHSQSTGEFIPNRETAEQHWADREGRLIAPARRSVRKTIELLKANGIPAEEVDATASKKFAAKVKAAGKLGLILPEGFSL